MNVRVCVGVRERGCVGVREMGVRERGCVGVCEREGEGQTVQSDL